VTDLKLQPLTNDGWGVDSNCFVCEVSNNAGLRIPFHHDVEGKQVVAAFTLDDRFSGAPQYAHGGVSLAVLDEAMAWATIAVGGMFALTRETTSRFHRPVNIGQVHHVRAWISGTDGNRMLTEAEIVTNDGEVCVNSHATFVALDLDQATAAAGSTIEGSNLDFVTTP
jgi:acyl-coenzyme A thioesterase PaaI-like protein